MSRVRPVGKMRPLGGHGPAAGVCLRGATGAAPVAWAVLLCALLVLAPAAWADSDTGPHTDEVMAVAITADGRRIVSGSDDQTLKVWDLETGKVLRTFAGHTMDVEAVDVSPDGRLAVSASTDFTGRVWDLQTGEEVTVFRGHTDDVNAAAFFPDGETVATGGRDRVAAWTARTGDLLWENPNIPTGVYGIAVSPDGRHLATADWDGPVRLLDALTGRELWVGRHDAAVNRVAFDASGGVLVSGSVDGTAKVWDVATGLVRATIDHRAFGPVSGVTINPAGTRIYTGAFYGGEVREWDAQTGELLRTLEGHAWAVPAVAVSPDGQTLVSGSFDRTMRVWDLVRGETVHLAGTPLPPRRDSGTGDVSFLRVDGHTREAFALAAIPGTSLVASASDDWTVRVWDWERRVGLRTLRGHSDGVLDLAAAPDGSRLFSVSEDRSIQVWDPHTGQRLHHVPDAHDDDVEAVAVSPDGTILLTGSEDGTIRRWSLADWSVVWTVPAEEGGQAMAFTPDGRHFLAGHGPGAQHAITFRRVSDGAVVWRHPSHGGGTMAVAVSPDGRIGASVGWDEFGGARLYDLATGVQIASLAAHSPRIGVKGLQFSPDGTRLLVGSFDSTLSLWDVTAETLLHKMDGHMEAVADAVFTPDGTYVVSASFDSTVRLWDPQTGRFVHRFGLELTYQPPAAPGSE